MEDILGLLVLLAYWVIKTFWYVLLVLCGLGAGMRRR